MNDLSGVYFKDEQIKSPDVSYCCFYNCYGSSSDVTYGVAVFAASNESSFLYSSTVKCPSEDKPRVAGAQFDIQSFSSKVKYLNLTGGNSVYCGGIEIRRPEELVFSYQTITHMKSWFCIALTDVINEDNEIEYSNILSVSLISGEAEHPYPGIIHIRAPLGSALRFTISHFIFYDTDFPTDDCFLLSRGVYNGNEQPIEISFIDCVADVAQSKFADNYRPDLLKIIDCIEHGINPRTNEILHLNLGECDGVTKTFQGTNFFTFGDLPPKIAIIIIGFYLFPLILV